MSENGREVADRYYQFMGSSVDRDTVADLYALDALVIRFDATATGPDEIDTSNGLLETTEVFVLGADGKIERHIPGIRGYWGL